MNNLVTQEGSNPFNRALAHNNANAGAVAIESERAIAEAQGQLILAKRFPRDLNAAAQELLDACKLSAMANVAFYALPRGGKSIVGPSVRLAEEIARCYGNFEYGHRELSRGNGKSEVEVYAWDKQSNNRSIRQITVMHTIDTKDGPRPLRDQKDIDDKIANVASKQIRGRILAMMPKWLVESAIQECRATLEGQNAEPVSARVRKMTSAFSAFGVTVAMIERRLEHKLDGTTSDELIDLLAIYNAIRDGAKASDYFEAESLAEPASLAGVDAVAAAAAANKKPAAAPKPSTAAKPVVNKATKKAPTEPEPSTNVEDESPDAGHTEVQPEPAQSQPEPQQDPESDAPDDIF